MNTKTSLKKTEHENVVPFQPLTMFEEMERMFEHFMSQSWMRPIKLEHLSLTEIYRKSMSLIRIIQFLFARLYRALKKMIWTYQQPIIVSLFMAQPVKSRKKKKENIITEKFEVVIS